MSDTPIDIRDLRAKAAANNAAKWSPADALHDFVGEVERGDVKPDQMIICYTETVDGQQQVGYRNVSPSGLVSLGILERVKWHLNNR